MIGPVTGEGVEVKKHHIVIFTDKQHYMTIDIKTKVVQHAPRINISI